MLITVAITSFPRIFTLEAANASTLEFRDVSHMSKRGCQIFIETGLVAAADLFRREICEVIIKIGVKRAKPGSVRIAKTPNFKARYRSLGRRKSTGICVWIVAIDTSW